MIVVIGSEVVIRVLPYRFVTDTVTEMIGEFAFILAFLDLHEEGVLAFVFLSWIDLDFT